MTEANTDKQNSIEWIATLRGLSILLVFVSHSELPIDLNSKFMIGRVGVVCFVMISGYLASISVAKRNTKQFLLNRLIRIYPTYWLMLLMFFAVDYTFGEFTITDYLVNMTLFAEYVHVPLVFFQSWMLSILLMSYVVISIANRCSALCNNIITTLFLMIAMTAAIARNLAGIALPVAVPLLVSIAMLGYMTQRSIINPKLTVFNIVCFTVSLMVAYPDMKMEYIIGYIIGMMLFYSARHMNVAVRWFQSFGKSGYAFYIGALIPYAITANFFPSWVENTSPYITFIVHFTFTWLLGVVFTEFIEKRILQCGKQFEQSFS